MRQREHLIHMANQIARNLAPMGGDAAAAVADHIAAFWSPAMRSALLADRDGLDQMALAAVELLAAQASAEQPGD